MTEHAEAFLSLYRADMDAALRAQPADSWSSFPLFQLLNNFLRGDGEWRARLLILGPVRSAAVHVHVRRRRAR